MVNDKIFKILNTIFIELFDNFMQQDSHEFFNFLLNAISEVLADEKKKEQTNGTLKNANAQSKQQRSNNINDQSARFAIFFDLEKFPNRIIKVKVYKFLNSES
jgi:ubiquitin C-terminal hydrolase